MLDRLVDVLFANGPVVVVLGAVVYELRRLLLLERETNRVERERHATEEQAKDDKLIELLNKLADNAKGDHKS